jgi:predicted ester cyclase
MEERVYAQLVEPDAMRALVRRHIEDGFNPGDWTVCETTMADDYTAFYGADGNANVGRDEYVRVCRFLRKSFPDVNITIEELIVEGDRIVMRYTERGTLTGRAFLGIEPAGQPYAKPGTTIYRVTEGRLAESWGVEDTLGWFRQLGAVPDSI